MKIVIRSLVFSLLASCIIFLGNYTTENQVQASTKVDILQETATEKDENNTSKSVDNGQLDSQEEITKIVVLKDSDGLTPGTLYQVSDVKDGDFLLTNGTSIPKENCMVDIKELAPHIIVHLANSENSIFKAHGVPIAGVTGRKLYEENICWLQYDFAKKVAGVENTIEKDGYYLAIYDGFRANAVSKYVNQRYSFCYNKRKDIYEAVNRCGYGTKWFLAQSISTHNVGCAIDVTLAYYDSDREIYRPYRMQTDMHDLTAYSAHEDKLTKEKIDNDNADLLESIMTKAGFDTLASEWWHYQDSNLFKKYKEYYDNVAYFNVNPAVIDN